MEIKRIRIKTEGIDDDEKIKEGYYLKLPQGYIEIKIFKSRDLIESFGNVVSIEDVNFDNMGKTVLTEEKI